MYVLGGVSDFGNKRKNTVTRSFTKRLPAELAAGDSRRSQDDAHPMRLEHPGPEGQKQAGASEGVGRICEGLGIN